MQILTNYTFIYLATLRFVVTYHLQNTPSAAKKALKNEQHRFVKLSQLRYEENELYYSFFVK
jgi:hypothetical protein